MIWIDSREHSKHPNLVQGLSKIFGPDMVRVEYQEVGDFYITGVKRCALVERKSVLDFVKSIGDRRIWNQLLGMCSVRENVEKRILIEGSLDKIREFSQWSMNSVMANLLSIEVDWGVKVTTIPSFKWVTIYLRQLQERLGRVSDNRFYPSRAKKHTRTMEEEVRGVLEGIKNIGPSSAHALLALKGTIQAVASASPEELAKARGISTKRALHISDVMRHLYRYHEG